MTMLKVESAGYVPAYPCLRLCASLHTKRYHSTSGSLHSLQLWSHILAMGHGLLQPANTDKIAVLVNSIGYNLLPSLPPSTEYGNPL